jgi:hypothetical protein
MNIEKVKGHFYISNFKYRKEKKDLKHEKLFWILFQFYFFELMYFHFV